MSERTTLLSIEMHIYNNKELGDIFTAIFILYIIVCVFFSLREFVNVEDSCQKKESRNLFLSLDIGK